MSHTVSIQILFPDISQIYFTLRITHGGWYPSQQMNWGAPAATLSISFWATQARWSPAQGWHMTPILEVGRQSLRVTMAYHIIKVIVSRFQDCIVLLYTLNDCCYQIVWGEISAHQRPINDPQTAWCFHFTCCLVHHVGTQPKLPQPKMEILTLSMCTVWRDGVWGEAMQTSYKTSNQTIWFFWLQYMVYMCEWFFLSEG